MEESDKCAWSHSGQRSPHRPNCVVDKKNCTAGGWSHLFFKTKFGGLRWRPSTHWCNDERFGKLAFAAAAQHYWIDTARFSQTETEESFLTSPQQSTLCLPQPCIVQANRRRPCHKSLMHCIWESFWELQTQFKSLDQSVLDGPAKIVFAIIIGQA